MAVRGVPRPRDVINNQPKDDDDDDDAAEVENKLDGVNLEGMTEKERKLWDKKTTRWRIFVDFLFRHISIVTFKFNCFDKEESIAFMVALDKAEGLRSQMKLKKGRQAHISSINIMSKSADMLTSHNFILESNRIRKYLDLAARIKGLALIALGFSRALTKGKAPGAEKLKHHIDVWRGMCLRSFDYTTLSLRRGRYSGSPPAPGSLEARFGNWSAAMRSTIFEAQTFLQKACRIMGVSLSSPDPLNTLQKHMQAAEYVLASHLNELLSEDKENKAKAVSREQRSAAMALLHGGPVTKLKNSQWELPNFDDVDPELLQPISEYCVMLEIPTELPKEKKGKRKRGAKGGKKSSKKSTSKKTKKKSTKK